MISAQRLMPQTTPMQSQRHADAEKGAENSPRRNSHGALLSASAPRRSHVIIAWLLALPLMLIGIGHPEVSRTQEARVLEVARQMIGRPAIDWIIPKINGDVRIQKPPLTYWMSALAFKIGGVSEGVGRIPTAFLGWFMLAVVYCSANWLFGRRAGFLSAACLLGSYYFARHTRLAETDIPATLFVTLAMYALWRGSVDRSDRQHEHPGDGSGIESRAARSFAKCHSG